MFSTSQVMFKQVTALLTVWKHLITDWKAVE